MSLRIHNATILTMDDAWTIRTGDLWIDDGRITAIGTSPAGARPKLTGADERSAITGADERSAITIDARGGLVIPGFIQTHIHLCQTLFRGAADDLPLLAWLRERVWPLEAAHDERTLTAATRLAAAELSAGGTTSILTMETVHGTDAVLEALVATGMRAVVGKCLMDSGDDAPARLKQPLTEALDESVALDKRWRDAAGGRLRTALAPRFAISCSPALLEATAALSASAGLLVHTHASEQYEEVAIVRARTGLDNMAYLASVGLATERLCAAHCVWVTEAEQQLMAERSVKVLHCPGSNLKLGSGVAPVYEMRARGIAVSLGADGAACNNTLDMFYEMRLAATLQAMRYGPGALPAREAVWMATREGARALGQADQIGSIEIGKRADVVVINTDGVHQRPATDPYATLVYSCRPSDVIATIIDGRVVYRDGALAWGERESITEAADQARTTLRARAGV